MQGDACCRPLSLGSCPGADQWPAIIDEDTPSPRREILHNIDPGAVPLPGRSGVPHPKAAVRVGDYKLILNQPPSGWGPNPSGTQICTAATPLGAAAVASFLAAALTENHLCGVSSGQTPPARRWRQARTRARGSSM
eukprot:COSAG01_NODE_10333_length_2191_cov_2.011950_2_plen_137_part_00